MDNARKLSRLLRRCCCPVLLICLTVFIQNSLASEPLYGRRIIVTEGASPRLIESAEVLRHWLERMTREPFQMEARLVSDQKEEGIYLFGGETLNQGIDDLAELKMIDNPEAFLIVGNTNQLRIIGKTDDGLELGIYWYLDRLGCRWLLPGERWTIIPQKSDVTINVNAVQAPAFQLRQFFGTGSFGRPAIDPDQKVAKSWALYQRQNWLGGKIRLGGHAGEAFALKHKNEWLKHPEYLAENNGKRQVWSPEINVKLCSSNPGLQALWISDRIEELRTQLNADSTTRSVSVEPSDGGGHCECGECRKLGSISDQVFTLANLVAREVQRQLPGKSVNLYAYNEHSAPPEIAIEPNVIVSVVPYGFQRTGLTAEEFILAWEKKCGSLAMYDYWNIPDWSRNLPDLPARTLVQKIRFWKDHHVKYFLAESTYSGGSMGLNWFLASRLLWDPTLDERRITDDYFEQAFGPAQLPLRRMSDRWNQGFILSDHELGLAHRDLQEALSLTSDPAITARLIDVGRYIHAMSLWYDYTLAPAKSAVQIDAAKEYVTYLWRTYESNQLQAFRLAQLIDRDMHPLLAEYSPDAHRWKDVPQFSDQEILERLEAGKRKYQPLEFQHKDYSSRLIPLASRPGPLSEKMITTGLFGYSSEFRFAPPAGVEQIAISIRVNAVSGPGKSDRVHVTDPQGIVVFEEKVNNAGEWFELIIPTAKSGTYALTIMDQKNSFSLRISENLPLVCSNDYSCVDLSPRTYFYVPRGQRKIAVHSPGVIPLKLFDPQGNLIQVARNDQGRNLFVIDSDGKDGQVWSFSQFKSWEPLQLLNCPNVFAFTPEAMMVPEEISDNSNRP